jgi:four helix bundle protein
MCLDSGMSDYVPIEKLEVTVRFENLSDWIWDQVMTWPRIAQNTIGEQILNASDSVAANIVEGGHRDGDRDALRFFMFARGSAGETAYFLRRAIKRKLLPEPEGNRVHDEWNSATQLLNNLIKYRRSRIRSVKESRGGYEANEEMTP